MTAQIGDSYSYKGGDYTIVAMSEPLRFDPRFYGFKPESATTACWNGFWCKYKISEDGIFLDNIHHRIHQIHYNLLYIPHILFHLKIMSKELFQPCHTPHLLHLYHSNYRQ